MALKVLWGGADPALEPWRRVVRAALLLVAVLTVGTIGYALLGLSLLDSSPSGPRSS